MANKLSDLYALDRTIHEPGRLLILTALYPVEKMEYLRLQREWKFKQGNLSSHLKKLRQAGYVSVQKTFKGSYPQTWCSMTEKGRDALYAYSQMLKEISKTTESSGAAEK